jgi:hypothetical protein
LNLHGCGNLKSRIKQQEKRLFQEHEEKMPIGHTAMKPTDVFRENSKITKRKKNKLWGRCQNKKIGSLLEYT